MFEKTPTCEHAQIDTSKFYFPTKIIPNLKFFHLIHCEPINPFRSLFGAGPTRPCLEILQDLYLSVNLHQHKSTPDVSTAVFGHNSGGKTMSHQSPEWDFLSPSRASDPKTTDQTDIVQTRLSSQERQKCQEWFSCETGKSVEKSNQGSIEAREHPSFEIARIVRQSQTDISTTFTAYLQGRLHETWVHLRIHFGAASR